MSKNWKVSDKWWPSPTFPPNRGSRLSKRIYHVKVAVSQRAAANAKRQRERGEERISHRCFNNYYL